MLDRYDLIVVGAGVCGLAAGVSARLAGQRVLILERSALAGGGAACFTRGRFEFEALPRRFSGLGAGDRPGLLGRLLGSFGVGGGIDWLTAPGAWRVISAGEGVDARLPFGADGFCEELERCCEGSGRPAGLLMDCARETAEALGWLAETEKKAASLVGFVRQFPRAAALAPYSAERVMERLGLSPEARGIVGSLCLSLGCGAGEISFADFALELWGLVAEGAYIPKYRSADLVAALLRRYEQLGGELITGAEAAQLLLEPPERAGKPERVGGVICCDARSFLADRVALSCPLPDERPAEKGGARPFTLYLGLCRTPEELAITDRHLYIYPSFSCPPAPERADAPYPLAAYCPNVGNADDCAPGGGTILQLTRLFSGDWWDRVPDFDLPRLKNALARDMIGRYEAACGVSISDCIEELETATPLTFERYTGAVGEQAPGCRPRLWDNPLTRAFAAIEAENERPRCGGRTLAEAMLSGALAGAAKLGEGEAK